LGWGDAEPLREGPREGRRALVPRVERDLEHAAGGGLQLDDGGLEPHPLHMLPERFADHRPEDPVEMARREAGDGREPVERELLAAVAGDVEQDTVQPFVVVVQGGGAVRCHGTWR